jgi:hypothetical protein
MKISIHKSSRTDTEKHPCPGQPDEEITICEIQLSYGTLLSRLTKLGFAFLLATFVPYFFGILGNYVPRHLLARYWGQPLFRYLELTQVKTGWSWLWELHHGDFLNLLPLAFLASITVICLATVTTRFFRNREPLQGIIAILEILVLVVAASGFLTAGGH